MFKKAVIFLKKGYQVIMPTDTLYGIHALALNKKAVDNVYKIRGRAPDKPFIILIGSIDQLKLFEIGIDQKTRKILNKYWPGKISIILPCPQREFKYLHRGKKSLAFRVPDKKDLRELILKTGPLISTSVNPEGNKPAKTIAEAKKYFGNKISFYLNQGTIDNLPSTIIKLNINSGKVEIIRQGEVKVD